MTTIVPITTPQQIDDMIALSTEYVTWMVQMINETYPEIDTTPFLQSHSYENVKSRFPGEYVPPYGGLFLAIEGEQVCGCGALSKWTDTIAEIQTLFVRPEYRGHGIARALVTHIIDTATSVGYQTMRLDTLAFMTSAQKLYQTFGFYAIEPYRTEAGEMAKHIRYFELNLQAS